ncbi:MAG: anthranilate phosphoribosyltransferase [Actinomycetota bacterium]
MAPFGRAYGVARDHRATINPVDLPPRPRLMAAVDVHGGWPGLLGRIADSSDLDRAQAQAALADMLDDAATPAQTAGFIVGLRIKGETVEELTGLATAMLDVAEPLALPADAVDIVGTGGSAHRRQHALNISTMACLVAAGAGATVCKHGNRRASSTSGAFDFLEAIGVGIELTPEQLSECVSTVGVGFAFARTFHPTMRFVGPVRAELGIPTVFNVLGPLAHPGRIRRQVVGTATVELAEKMAGVLANLGRDRAWVVSGHGGLDELSLTGPTTVFDVGPDGINRHEIDPADLGLTVVPSLDAIAGGDAARNAELFQAILDGSERGARRDIVVLNAAAGLVVAGVSGSLTEAVAVAADSIDSGAAREKLAALVAFCQT